MISQPKLLIIDDDIALHMALAKALRDEDYQMSFAHNGRSGLEMVRKVPPALIFLDLLMPVMGGLEFLKELKHRPEDPFMIIVITGHGDDSEIRSCYELGVDFFLRKPLSMVEVQCLARRCLAMKKLEQEKAALITELQKAADTIKDLKRILPICASCKKIRLGNGYWQEVEVFFQTHADMDFSHSICPQCIKRLYPEIDIVQE